MVWGWAIIGMMVETYGFWLLFSGFFPTVLSFLRRLPYLGGILDLPVMKTVRDAKLVSIVYLRLRIAAPLILQTTS